MNIVALCIILLLMFFLKSSLPASLANPLQSSSLALGFIMLFAFLAGKNINRLKLPQITGFILAGILGGPFLLKLLSVAEVKNLQLLDGLALSLIALTAGGEMEIARLRKNVKGIMSIVIFQTVVIVSGFVAFGFVGRSFFPLFRDKSSVEILSIALLFGTLATATSPSTTIAIITETKAKGKYTNLILSSAVVKDFLVIILFAFALSFSRSFLSPEEAFNINFLKDILLEVGMSLVMGLVVGAGIIFYLKYIKREVTIFILSIAFFTYQISQTIGLHSLLVCLLAGFLVKNFSLYGEKFILAIERSSLPVYVVFFAISGASIDLNALEKSWWLALIFVVWRGGLKFLGTFAGGKIAREDSLVNRQSWAGFISQAGVALGMAIIIENTFPVWGGEFKALILAVIGLNQIVGPVLLQKFLLKTGETGQKVV